LSTIKYMMSVNVKGHYKKKQIFMANTMKYFSIDP